MAGRSGRHRFLGLLALALLAVSADAAERPPLDLTNPTPRRIEVRFEISPADQPGRLDTAWSEPRPGLLEPTSDPDRVRIRIPAREMEAHLTSTGTTVVPGSFSDFVWILDRVSGHVVEAGLAGRIHERIGFGPLAARIAVDIRVDMSTERGAGFRTGRAPFGIETHDFCSPEDGSRSCVPVASRRFDPQQGYVNAVGSIRAATPMAEVRAFSPLGEVRFSERPADAIVQPTGTTRERDAVFSPATGPDSGLERGGWHGDSAERADERTADRSG
ncbi:MAG: hypothetical protein U0900_02145 [Myxococcota bacterium]